MKKRLRKKLHVGEFTEWGFQACFSMRSEYCEQTPQGTWLSDNFLDEFLVFIESIDLGFGGCCTESFTVDGFITRLQGIAVTEENRHEVKTWLEAHRQVKEITKLGALVDSNRD